MNLDYTQIIIQLVISVTAILGGTGFWTYISQKQDKKNGLSAKVDSLSNDIKAVKDSLEREKLHRIEREQNDDLVRSVANEERKAIINSQKALMRERLLENAHKCFAKGYYTEQEREVFHDIYEIYVNEPYNGNGVIHQFQPLLIELPFVDPNAKNK